jgi:hypothetical protein
MNTTATATKQKSTMTRSSFSGEDSFATVSPL